MTGHLPIELLLRQRDEAAARYHDVKESLVLWAMRLWQSTRGRREEIWFDFARAAEDLDGAERIYRRINKELGEAQRAYRQRLAAKTSQGRKR